jgi:hypothetical protein
MARITPEAGVAPLDYCESSTRQDSVKIDVAQKGDRQVLLQTFNVRDSSICSNSTSRRTHVGEL